MSLPLAISLGDPAGIGPELIVQSWIRREAEGLAPFCVAGGARLLADAAKVCGLDVQIVPVAHLSEAAAIFPRALPVLAGCDGDYAPGTPTANGAKLALQSLQIAASAALAGDAAALVTGPVAKAEMAKVGFAFPGQTEFVADACGIAAQDAVMMLAGPSLKTVPLTVHCALADVPAMITQELILRRCRVVHRAMQRDFGLPHPRIAIAGLNPHAGEDGRMGGEEISTIIPAIAKLQAEGIDATGPHPADTLFAAHKRGGYDVAVAMYHDQALVPLKTLDFDQGVNMTLGLPIIRTSPDHGTAFDIAGKGAARADSTIAAIRLATQAAAFRRGAA